MKNVEDLYHLTPVQRELLSDTQASATPPVVQISVSLTGELDSDGFERAWKEVLRRHTSLRTCFLSAQLEEPVQVVRQEVKLLYERCDWAGNTPEEQEEKLQELLIADSKRGFDPARAPLFRLTEIRFAIRSCQLILSYHPLLLDEISARRMLREVFVCYRAGQQESAPLYRDYVGWVERQDLAGAELYWRKSFDTTSLLNATRAAQLARFSRQATFPADALKSFARHAQLSFETSIVGAWSLVLMRDRNCGTVSIGVVASERPGGLPESERMLGLLQNILPLPLAITGEEPMSSWLQEVERRRTKLQRYAHISRAQIKQWIDAGNEQSLFDSVVLCREPWSEVGVEEIGLAIGKEAIRYNGVMNFPLTLEATLGEELSLTLHSDGSVDESTVARLLESLRNTLDRLTFPALYLSKDFSPALHVTTNGDAHKLQLEKPLDFSLFYFADDNAVYGEDKYRLYREGAKFADRHGLTAVWTPERHFHEKAGLYPNPSVLSAALATITEHVQLRAGSVVLPLHNSLRVAEEWSVVDNLSKGRVGVSFTSGWMPNDFAFFPERYAVKREEMFRGIQEVQDLWRGKPIAGRDGVGKEIELRIFPKPIRAELPIWLTCSGGPEMFEKAGELGCHVLTALLTQSIEEVTPKIKLYRDSLARHGHNAADGKVTMMMHTFIGEDPQAVLQKVRVPLTNYLKSHLNLIETGAESLNLQVEISEEEKEKYQEQLAAFAFERYYRTASLIGTPGSCMKMVERLKAIGVDEIACLIDFGVDVDSVMESLSHLAVLKDLCNELGHKEAQKAQMHLS